MSLAAHFPTVAEGRRHFKDLLDAAEDGLPNSVEREHMRAVLVDAGRLRRSLESARPARAEVVAEAGGWSVMLPGLPLAADGASVDEALDDMVDALREYASDWTDHLRVAPNHEGNWDLVQLVDVSSDDELKDWLGR